MPQSKMGKRHEEKGVSGIKKLPKKKKFNVPKKSKFILKQHWEHGLACYIGKSKSFPSLSNVKKKHKLSLIYKAGRGINWY